MSQRFEPQQGAYTVTVDDSGETYNTPYKVKFSYTPRDGQTVTFALDEQSDAGAELVHKGGASNHVYSLELSDGAEHEASLATGTAIVKITVSQTGYTAAVYTVTVNYTIHPVVEAA